jgi:CspA family cold shock protein
MSEGQVVRGTVVWFSKEKGYGFLQPADGGKEVFVHYSGINISGFKTLEKDEQVEFVIVKGKKGPQAENVIRLGFDESGSS